MLTTLGIRGISLRAVLCASLCSLAILVGTAIGPFGAQWTPEDENEFAFVAYAERPNGMACAEEEGGTETAKAPAAAVKTAESSAPLDMLTGTVRRGSTLGQVLAENGVSKAQIRQIQTALKPRFDFKKAVPGDSFLVTQNAQGQLLSFELQHGRRDVFRVLPSGDNSAFRVERSDVPVERRIARIGGVVEKNMLHALLQQGERGELVDRFADIFVWQIDFAQDSEPGDEYRLVVEKYYDAEGFVRYGRILAAQYVTPEIDLTAIYYENDKGHADYYTPAGRSLRRSFLRAPLRFTRISSGYAKVRFHPILNRFMKHEAIDYAAPIGTPVWAVAEGKVTGKGWMGGLGRTVLVEHKNGCVTYYGHLSRYGDINVGSTIRQRRVIGYVGDSGMTTGPHLHFCMKCGGRFVDPSKVTFRPEDGEPVRMEELFAFEKLKQSRMAELRSASPQPLMLQAGM